MDMQIGLNGIENCEIVILIVLLGLNVFIIWFPFHREYISKTPSVDLSKKIYNKDLSEDRGPTEK